MKNIDFIKYFFSSILSLSMATSINLRALETNPPLSSQPVKINFGNPYSNSSTLLVVDGSYILNGMFSVFLICLGVLDKFEQGHFGGLWINLNAGAYFEPTKGPNWWNYYFNPIAIIPNRAWIPHVIPQNELYKIGFNSLFYLSKQRGHELIQKYISIHPFIVEEVEDFTRKYFDKSHIIGVHYRGTDKTILEISRVDYQKVVQTIRETINELSEENRSNYKLFIATDEQSFLDYIKTSFSCPIIYTTCCRSIDNFPIHYNGNFNNYLKGKEALIDCLLLSRCHLLIRTESNLSKIAEFFNPCLPVKHLYGQWKTE